MTEDLLPPIPVPISALFDRRSHDGNVVSFVITEDWMQGRTTFGGLIAALAVQAMRDVLGSDVPLRALQTNFIGPVGGTTAVDVRLLRQGRNVRQVQATVRSGGETAAIVLGVFGIARKTAVPGFHPTQPSVSVSAEAAIELPFIPGVTPNFTQHLQSRWAEGERPFTGKASWHSRIHTRLREPGVRAVGVDAELTTILLADMPPTPVLSFFQNRAAASSVSWELELVPLAAPADCEGWWRVDTEVVSALEGYVNQRTTLWSPEGTLAALGYQVVGVYG